MNTFRMAARNIPLDDSWDVIVAGGGPAGSAAATAAARGGARTLLIEMTSALGGMGTLGLVPWFCGYDDGEKIIACGLAGRVRTELGDAMPLLRRWMQEHPLQAPAIDPEALKRIYDRMVTEAGATPLFMTQLAAVEKGDTGVDAIIVAGKAGLRAYRAKVYIDCTGDGDLATWAGAPFEKGGPDGDLQSATHCFMLTNVDEFHLAAGPSVHFFDPESPIHKAIASGRYPLITDLHSCSIQIGPRTFGYNTGHVYDVDNTDPESVSRGLLYGREQAAQYRAAFAEFHPAFAASFLAATGSLLGIRETRRIMGDYVLTREDYLARRSFPDEICRNAYNIDVHTKPAPGAPPGPQDIEKIKKQLHEQVQQLGPGESYGVPYRCLTPRGLRNVLVAGRCISTDRPVNGSIRIMACCLTTGEAAGTAAALAAAEDSDVHAVDTARLRDLLKMHGAYLP